MSTTAEAVETKAPPGDSLKAVRAALANAEGRDETSKHHGRRGEPFVCATVGLRISDLKAVLEQAERHRLAYESAQSALEDAQAGRPLRDGLGRHDAYTLTVEKLRATKADLATAAKVTAELRAEIETLREEVAGKEANLQAMARQNAALLDELRAVKESREECLAALEDVVSELGSDSEMYGAFHGGDPRDFTPDPECSTVEERAAHAAACREAESNEESRRLPDSHSWVILPDGVAHVCSSGFGLGTTKYVEPSLERARAATAKARRSP